jgi:CRP/FNR family transcriptional regulator
MENWSEQFYFPESHLDKIREFGTELTLPKDHILLNAGDVPECCYYIEQGQIISYEYNAYGTERVFSTNEPGSLVLVPSMIITHPVLLNFRTSKPSKLVCLENHRLYDLIASEPDIAADMIYLLSGKLIATIEQYRESGNYSVKWRLCNLFLTMADQSGIDYDGKVLIQQKISQQSMANQIQANRVTIARNIRELKDLGLIEYINGYYCIRDVARLKRHMDYVV